MESFGLEGGRSLLARWRAALSRAHSRALHRLRHRRRRVLVRVLVGGREVDSFWASRPQTLCSALRPTYAHLPDRDASVEFGGVEEEWLPPGIGRTRREVDLPGPEVALSFLAASQSYEAPSVGRLAEMLHPFFLEIHIRQKRDQYLDEARRERLLREAGVARQEGQRGWLGGGLREVYPGVLFRTLVSGPRLMVTEMVYRERAATPVHSHPSEQAGYVLAGRFCLVVDGQERVVGAGEAYLVPASAPHCLEAVEAGVVVDVFSPPRTDYLEPARRAEPAPA